MLASFHVPWISSSPLNAGEDSIAIASTIGNLRILFSLSEGLIGSVVHVDFCFPGPVALLFENPDGVAGDESLLAVVAYQLDGRLRDLIGIIAVSPGLGNVKGVIPSADLDPRLPELPDGLRSGDWRGPLEESLV
jgi:hypothetical protein